MAVTLQLHSTEIKPINFDHGFVVQWSYSDFQASCNAKPKSVERHLHTLMCSVSVVFIHTMEDDQRLNTLVHEGDALRFSIARSLKIAV